MSKTTPHFASDIPRQDRFDQLLADAAKLPALVADMKAGRGLSMRIPADGDDYDLLLTRIAALVPLVLADEVQNHII